jgi:hypothetical protein
MEESKDCQHLFKTFPLTSTFHFFIEVKSSPSSPHLAPDQCRIIMPRKKINYGTGSVQSQRGHL